MPDDRFNGINAATRYCAVYGHPVRHSASPAMHNPAMAELGLNWRYLAFDVHPDHLKLAIQGAAAMQFIGLNLTVPHKLLAMEFVDHLDESARKWGAVNTIRFEAKNDRGDWRPLREIDPDEAHEIRSHGFNTDAEAIIQALKEELGCAVRRETFLLLGAGGAGRVAALKLAESGVGSLHLVNRTISKAEGIADEIRRVYPEVEVRVGYPDDNVDVILNATSLGLKPDDPVPLDEREFSYGKAEAVFDMVYRPAETKFLQKAKAADCRVANGLGMLLHQGAKALELWTGKNPPIETMRAALKRNIYGPSEL